MHTWHSKDGFWPAFCPLETIRAEHGIAVLESEVTRTEPKA